MEVLKRGDKILPKKTECPYCGSVISFMFHEEKTLWGGYDDITHEREISQYIICPVCHDDIILNTRIDRSMCKYYDENGNYKWWEQPEFQEKNIKKNIFSFFRNK